jgi:hypothetical protein
MASDDAYDVFVSYARSDGTAAAGLNGWLNARASIPFLTPAGDVTLTPT